MKKFRRLLMLTIAVGLMTIPLVATSVSATHSSVAENSTHVLADTMWATKRIYFSETRNPPKAVWVERGAYKGYIYYTGQLRDPNRNEYYYYYTGTIRKGPYDSFNFPLNQADR